MEGKCQFCTTCSWAARHGASNWFRVLYLSRAAVPRSELRHHVKHAEFPLICIEDPQIPLERWLFYPFNPITSFTSI